MSGFHMLDGGILKYEKCQRQKYMDLFPPDIFHQTVLSFIPHQIAIVPLLKLGKCSVILTLIYSIWLKYAKCEEESSYLQQQGKGFVTMFLT